MRDLGGWPHQTKNPCRNQPSLISSLLTKPSTIPSCNVAESLFLVVDVLSPIRWRGRRTLFASDRSRLSAQSPRRSPRSVIGIRRQMRDWGCPFCRQLGCFGAPRSQLFQRWLCVGILVAIGGEDGSEPFLDPHIQVLITAVACPTWLDNHTSIVAASIVLRIFPLVQEIITDNPWDPLPFTDGTA